MRTTKALFFELMYDFRSEARSVPRARPSVFSRNTIAGQRPAATTLFPLLSSGLTEDLLTFHSCAVRESLTPADFLTSRIRKDSRKEGLTGSLQSWNGEPTRCSRCFEKTYRAVKAGLDFAIARGLEALKAAPVLLGFRAKFEDHRQGGDS